jgi:hypothetical protein
MRLVQHFSVGIRALQIDGALVCYGTSRMNDGGRVRDEPLQSEGIFLYSGNIRIRQFPPDRTRRAYRCVRNFTLQACYPCAVGAVVPEPL